jgi:hypothetical protein
VGAFVGIVVLCVAVAVGYVGWSRGDEGSTLVVDDERDAGSSSLDEVSAAPHLLFRHTGDGDDYGRVVMRPMSKPDGSRALTDLRCDRVSMRAGVGVCLRGEPGIFPRYRGLIFDRDFGVRHEFDLAGQPSRTQVSDDGRFAAYTVFVTGHSYADGAFSTRTAIIDTGSGREVAELEQFEVTNEGRSFDREDFNFWGVTFTGDANRFYATLGTGGRFYLVEGDVVARTATVVTDDVECPSLSPDGTRLAYKVRHGDGFGPVSWTIAALDLRTMNRTDLSETRSVDDQVAWLDDDTVMYGLDDAGSFSPRTDVYTVAADGSGAPSLLVEEAWSPTLVTAP